MSQTRSSYEPTRLTAGQAAIDFYKGTTSCLGRYLAIGAPNDRLFGQLMGVLRIESHASDPRFASYASRKVHEDALLAVVEPAVRLRAAPELEAALPAAGVPCAQVNDFKEVFDHPQIIARGVVQDVVHPRLGRMRTTRNPILLARELATVDVLSGGRMILGTGSGHVAAESKALGLDFAARGRMHDEHQRVIRLLLSEEEATFHGEFISFGPLRPLIRTIQRGRSSSIEYIEV
jgi:hypothetical protein